MANQVEMLESIINDPNSSQDTINLAQTQLNKLQSIGGAQVQLAAMEGAEADAELTAILHSFQNALKGT